MSPWRPEATFNRTVRSGPTPERSSQAVTASTTKVLYLDLTSSGALIVGSSYPTMAHVRLATVVAGSSTITSITDNRQCFDVVGSVLDGVNWTFGQPPGRRSGRARIRRSGSSTRRRSSNPPWARQVPEQATRRPSNPCCRPFTTPYGTWGLGADARLRVVRPLTDESGLATQAVPIFVALYLPGKENPYTILPNIFCLRIDYREGPEPPLARFQYLTGDLCKRR